MSALLYFTCLVLLIPIAGMAAWGFLIDSLVNMGLWAVIKVLFAPLYDPLGKGIWVILFFLGLLGVAGIGFVPGARQFGFGAIAAIGVLSTIYVVKVYPNEWALGSLLLFVPSTVSVAIGFYCVLRPLK